jgi:nitroreductase
MLAAQSLGLGTCWVNRADEQMSYDYVQKMLEAIGIDHKDYIGVGHITIGYPKGEVKKASPRKENYIYKIV